MACLGLFTHLWAAAKPSIPPRLCYVFKMCICVRVEQSSQRQTDEKHIQVTSKEGQFLAQACV